MIRTFPASAPGAPSADSTNLHDLWFPIFVLGGMSFIIGVLAIIAPYFGISVFVAILGALLVIEGIAEVIHALLVRQWRVFGLHLLAAALYLLVGLFILEDRDRAADALPLLLAAAFLVGGLLRIIFSITVQFPAWSWVLVNGLADLIIGVLFVTGWAGPGYAVIGLLVGLDLLLHAWSWLVLSWYARTPVEAPSDQQGGYRP
jgi:uncharacterized membrane protein HdeD (DUF308 family)